MSERDDAGPQGDTRRRRREQRMAQRGPAKTPRWALVVSGALLVASGGVWLMMWAADAQAAPQIAQNDAQIARLERDLHIREGAMSENVLDELTGEAAAARDLARAVAMEQTYYSTLLAEGDHSDPGNGLPSAATLDAVTQRERLAPFFAPESFVVDDDITYQHTAAAPLPPDRIDPRYAWFANPESEWKVASVVSSGGAGEVTVTWLSRNRETGELYAWARARYVAERDLFHDVQVVTTLGAAVDLDSEDRR